MSLFFLQNFNFWWFSVKNKVFFSKNFHQTLSNFLWNDVFLTIMYPATNCSFYLDPYSPDPSIFFSMKEWHRYDQGIKICYFYKVKFWKLFSSSNLSVFHQFSEVADQNILCFTKFHQILCQIWPKMKPVALKRKACSMKRWWKKGTSLLLFWGIVKLLMLLSFFFSYSICFLEHVTPFFEFYKPWRCFPTPLNFGIFVWFHF